MIKKGLTISLPAHILQMCFEITEYMLFCLDTFFGTSVYVLYFVTRIICMCLRPSLPCVCTFPSMIFLFHGNKAITSDLSRLRGRSHCLPHTLSPTSLRQVTLPATHSEQHQSSHLPCYKKTVRFKWCLKMAKCVPPSIFLPLLFTRKRFT